MDNTLKVFCFQKIHVQAEKIIFALGAKLLVFETQFNLKIKSLNLSLTAKHYFFKNNGSQNSKVENYC